MRSYPSYFSLKTLHVHYYYGLYGFNGLGVFDSWEQCKNCVKYVGDFHKYKKFTTAAEAIYWTISNYEKTVDVIFDFKIKPIKSLQMNFMLFTKNLRLKELYTRIDA